MVVILGHGSSFRVNNNPAKSNLRLKIDIYIPDLFAFKKIRVI